MTKEKKEGIRTVNFFSFGFTPSQSKYQTTERESLSVTKNFTEVRWLIQSPQFPSTLSSNRQALSKTFQSEDTSDDAISISHTSRTGI